MDGKSVVRGQEGLTFVIDAPYMDATAGGLANVSILVTTPEGGKFNGIFNTTLSGKDLTNFNLTGVQTLINQVSVPTTAQAGTYVLYAEFVLNNNGLFKEGTAMKDQYKKSASITVTVDTGDLDISIDKASVIRSNPFLVTISGEAQTTYALVGIQYSFRYLRSGQPERRISCKWCCIRLDCKCKDRFVRKGRSAV